MDDSPSKITEKGLKIAHLNVRSMFGGHKLESLKLQVEEGNFDIFTLSETWLTTTIPNTLIGLPTYSLCRLDRSWTRSVADQNPKKGGGLLCYIHKDLNYSESKYAHFNTSCPDLEMQWISLSLDHIRPIVIVNVYRPPQGDVKNCCTLVTKAFENAQFKENTEFYVLGDFNVNFKDSKSTAFKELNFTMRSLDLSQIINVPTRPSHRLGIDTSSILDLIFTNSTIISGSGTLDINLSDHLAVWAKRKKKFVKKEKVNFMGRSYKNYVKEDFQQSLSDHNWDAFFQMEDPNDLWQYMYRTILDYIDPMCPTKSFKVYSAREPWVTIEALELIKDKDRLLNKAKRTKKN